MIFAVIAAIVIGILAIVGLIMWIRAKRRAALANITMPCPFCQTMMTSANWDRHNILKGGEQYTCPHCGQVSIWNVTVTPPTLIS